MARKRHSPEEIIRKLREGESMLAAGRGLGEACRRLEISEQTYYRWRSRYGAMELDALKRLKALESENGRLKKLVADLALDLDMLRAVARGKY